MKNDRITLNKLIEETEKDIISWNLRTKKYKNLYYFRDCVFNKLIGKKNITENKIIFFVIRYNIEENNQQNFGLRVYLVNNNTKTSSLIYEITPGIFTFRVNSLINKLIKTIENKLHLIRNSNKINMNNNEKTKNGISFNKWQENRKYPINSKVVSCSNNNLLDLKGISEFNELEKLYCYKNGIKSLEHLNKSYNLNELNTSDNNLSNLNGIESCLKLKTLYCSNNNIKNIDAIKNLINIERLDISNNKLSNVDVIKNLKNLKVLYFYNNNFNPSYLNEISKWCKENNIISI
jgi:Leucine-rich repeat (LRR) protein